MAKKERVAIVTIEASIEGGYPTNDLIEWIAFVEVALAALKSDANARPPASYATYRVIDARLVTPR